MSRDGQPAAGEAGGAPAQQKTVAITRSPDDAAEFLEMARNKSIRAHALPTIQLVSRGDKIVNEFLDAARAESPDYAVFMSSKAVRLLFDTARRLDGAGGSGGKRQRAGEAEASGGGSATQSGSAYERLRLAVANMTVVAVGPKTRDSLESEGIRVNEMPPKTYSSVGVGELFTRLSAVGRKAIIPRSGASTPFLRELLEKIGLDVVELHLYDVCAFSDTAAWNGFRAEFAGGRVDGIVFTSASSVRGFAEIMSKDYSADGLTERLSRTAVVAIGPFTADELKKAGVTHNVISEEHTVRGAFETMAREIGA